MAGVRPLVLSGHWLAGSRLLAGWWVGLLVVGWLLVVGCWSRADEWSPAGWWLLAS